MDIIDLEDPLVISGHSTDFDYPCFPLPSLSFCQCVNNRSLSVGHGYLSALLSHLIELYIAVFTVRSMVASLSFVGVRYLVLFQSCKLFLFFLFCFRLTRIFGGLSKFFLILWLFSHFFLSTLCT